MARESRYAGTQSDPRIASGERRQGSEKCIADVHFAHARALEAFVYNSLNLHAELPEH